MSDGKQGTQEERIQWLEERLAIRDKDSKFLSREMMKWSRLSAMWHGKYAIVKHENNQLRRKLFRAKAE